MRVNYGSEEEEEERGGASEKKRKKSMPSFLRLGGATKSAVFCHPAVCFSFFIA